MRPDAAGFLATLAVRGRCGFCAGLSFFSDVVLAVCVPDSPSFAEDSLVSSPGPTFAVGYSGETNPSLGASLSLLSGCQFRIISRKQRRDGRRHYDPEPFTGLHDYVLGNPKDYDRDHAIDADWLVEKRQRNGPPPAPTTSTRQFK